MDRSAQTGAAALVVALLLLAGCTGEPTGAQRDPEAPAASPLEPAPSPSAAQRRARLALGLEEVHEPTGGWNLLPRAPMRTEFPRVQTPAVWTGHELLIWSGAGDRIGNCSWPFADGAAYDPTAGTWRPLPEAPVDQRIGHAAVWTGERMLVWGGKHLGRTGDTVCGDGYPADGAAYDPATDTWQTLPEAPIDGRAYPVSAWTGRELLVLGGVDVDRGHASERPDGAAYDPTAATWRTISLPADAPSGEISGVWTGEELLVFIQREYTDTAAAGYAYDPAADRWRLVADGPAAAVVQGTMVWTGARVLAFGARSDNEDLFAYDPVDDVWITLPASPIAWTDEQGGDVTGSAAGATVLWAGDRLLVWGGARPREQYACVDYGCEDLPSPDFFEPAHLYDPATGSWTSTVEAPVARRSGTLAVWTGRSALLYGGRDEQLGYAGHSYDPEVAHRWGVQLVPDRDSRGPALPIALR